MKILKTMLLAYAVFTATWLILSTLGWFFGTFVTFKFVATHPTIMLMMLLFGWLPGFYIAFKYYKNKS